MNMNQYISTYLMDMVNPEQGLAMPLETQLTLLERAYDVEQANIKLNRYNQELDRSEEVEEEHTLLKISNIVCKSRPKLYLGDYWLYVDIVAQVPSYLFYYKTDINGEVKWERATHPHLSGGKPCLGTHEGELSTALSDGNFIGFASAIRNYLQSYTAGDTHYTSTHFRKCKIQYMLHGSEEIVEMFKEPGTDGHDIDIDKIARDPMRWEFPNDITAYGHFIVEGQQLKWLTDSMSSRRGMDSNSRLPGLSGYYDHRSLKDSSRHYGTHYSNIKKVMGYLFIAMEVGKMDVFHAYRFVQIFLETLWAQYQGDYDEETRKILQEMSNELNSSLHYRRWTINTRFEVQLGDERREEAEKLQRQVNATVGDQQQEGEFARKLQYVGTKFGNFLVLLTKMRPDLAQLSSYLPDAKIDKQDVDSMVEKYSALRTFVYRQAVETLEKDKRRFIRELNKTQSNNTQDYDGQGTLFSENL